MEFFKIQQESERDELLKIQQERESESAGGCCESSLDDARVHVARGVLSNDGGTREELMEK